MLSVCTANFLCTCTPKQRIVDRVDVHHNYEQMLRRHFISTRHCAAIPLFVFVWYSVSSCVQGFVCVLTALVVSGAHSEDEASLASEQRLTVIEVSDTMLTFALNAVIIVQIHFCGRFVGKSLSTDTVAKTTLLYCYL